jgi:cob(I)alamin adenosyltransferase
LNKITTRTGDNGSDARSLLLRVQNDLFDLGGSLAYPAAPFAENKLAQLDDAVAHYNAGLPPLKEFVLPGGSRAAALCHVARKPDCHT